MINSIFLHALTREFSVTNCRQFLLSHEDSVADPLETQIIMIGGFAETAEYLQSERLVNASQFPYCVLVNIDADCISIFQEYGSAQKLVSARRFLAWLLSVYQCRITDEYGNDLTERYAKEGIDIFYPPNLDQLAADQLLPLEQRPRR
jgi:hypothetical protein